MILTTEHWKELEKIIDDDLAVTAWLKKHQHIEHSFASAIRWVQVFMERRTDVNQELLESFLDRCQLSEWPDQKITQLVSWSMMGNFHRPQLLSAICRTFSGATPERQDKIVRMLTHDVFLITLGAGPFNAEAIETVEHPIIALLDITPPDPELQKHMIHLYARTAMEEDEYGFADPACATWAMERMVERKFSPCTIMQALMKYSTTETTGWLDGAMTYLSEHGADPTASLEILKHPNFSAYQTLDFMIDTLLKLGADAEKVLATPTPHHLLEQLQRNPRYKHGAFSRIAEATSHKIGSDPSRPRTKNRL